MDVQSINPENGMAIISLNNSIAKINTEGSPVAILHKVIRNQQHNEEVTQIFYSKGGLHIATGFSILDEDNFEALKIVINLIPALPSHIMLQKPNLNTSDDINITINYTLPDDKNLPVVLHTKGYQAYKQCLKILEEQKEEIIYIKK